ncbi:outer membrane beta-barrel protein [Polluticoccus soli]|uniref:outer membrane beta-barrel protein n=1 Tax=Polluticoccus soli TaxID=3034150 RepID=UPI0023E22379|nr:outer membrane beta-barrel protein [Flavipsychrobacter sp. JY13-12]
MKKLFLALLAVASITAANAQKGSILVFGTASVENRNEELAGDETEFRSWHIQPGIGYQFHDNMTAGLEGGYSYSAREREFGPASALPLSLLDDQMEWNIGAFYRYTHYFNQTFSVWGQFGVGYLNGDITRDRIDTVGNIARVATTVNDYHGFRAYITPAFAINVHNGWALNFGFGGIEYRNVNFDDFAAGDIIPESESRFNLTFGQQLNVGISKNIGCGFWSKKKAPKEPGMDTRGMKQDQEDDDDE